MMLESIRYVDLVIQKMDGVKKKQTLIVMMLMFLLWAMTGKVNLTS